MERELLKQNLEYFNQELLPYYIILHTTKGAIVINVQKENLKHLLGVPHSNFKLCNLRSKKFYEKLLDDKYDLFDLIDKNRFYDNNLLYEEELIYRKNYYFKTVFSSLFNLPEIHIYQKKFVNDQFNTDYIHFQLEDNFGLYIGIVGDDSSDYHYFNSVLAEYDNPTKYVTGPKIKVTKIQKVEKDKFNPNDFKFIHSKNYHIKNENEEIAKKSVDFKRLKNSINKLLAPNLKITLGKYGKNTIQVYKNDECIQSKENIPLNLTTANEIANYLMGKYED